MQTPAFDNPPPRSPFVSVVAWIFIVLTGFSTLIGIMQNLMLAFLFPLDEMKNAMQSAKEGVEVPPFAQFMFGHFQWYFLAFLLLSGATFVSSIGLLKRKNWARLAFIGFFAFGIAWNIAGLFFQKFFLSSMVPATSHAPTDFQSQFEIITTIMFVFACIMATAMSILFGWLIKRFTSTAVRAEFGAGAP
jgi:ABC-type antimicrobial peptide transport system permease subunit